VAKKISVLRTAEYFRERSARADIDKSKRILKRAGRVGLRSQMMRFDRAERVGDLPCDILILYGNS